LPDEPETDEERQEREDREFEAALERWYSTQLDKNADDER
jgi:hypothetical protein